MKRAELYLVFGALAILATACTKQVPQTKRPVPMPVVKVSPAIEKMQALEQDLAFVAGETDQHPDRDFHFTDDSVVVNGDYRRVRPGQCAVCDHVLRYKAAERIERQMIPFYVAAESGSSEEAALDVFGKKLAQATSSLRNILARELEAVLDHPRPEMWIKGLSDTLDQGDDLRLDDPLTVYLLIEEVNGSDKVEDDTTMTGRPWTNIRGKMLDRIRPTIPALLKKGDGRRLGVLLATCSADELGIRITLK